MARKPARSHEEFVLPYLRYLEDPDSLRDEAAIDRARAAVDRAKDPIAKVKAITALERAEHVDGEALRAEFVEHAAAWCEEADVTPSALTAYGVPREVLADAGLARPERTAKRRRPDRRQTVEPGRRRSPKLSLDEVAEKMPTGDFVVADLAAAIDREIGTTRNYLPKLIEAGWLTEVGPDPFWSGNGRARTVYRRT